jgi:hypothetical protein
MPIQSLQAGVFKQISASTNIKADQGALLGIFVSAASATPTITVYNSATTTTTDAIATVFTPVAGTWYFLPAAFSAGLYIVISGTVSCTIIYQ